MTLHLIFGSWRQLFLRFSWNWFRSWYYFGL